VDFVAEWAAKTELPAKDFIAWIGVARGKFYDWKKRYGKVNEHNAKVPRDHWLEDWERQAIIDYHAKHPLDGYRRLTFMMIDDDVVAVSPSSTYRVLRKAGLLDRWNPPTSRKGTGFVQPDAPHKHWHIDIAYLNVGGTFYYFCGVLDGFSRALLHWEIRESMKEADIELIVQRAHEKYPDAKPRIISDNGPQFIARDFKTFIRLAGMTHVRTAPYYPQSNGKMEAFNKTLKVTTIRPACPATYEEALRVVTGFIDYVAPLDKLEGRAEQILAERDRKLEAARERRRQRRQEQRLAS